MSDPGGRGNADLQAVLGPQFWSRVDPSGACWTWTGSINRNGYGTWSWGQRRRRFGTQFPHRCIWIALHGPIPAGYEVDHRCFVPACVRPSHLRLLTVRQNRQQRRIWLMHKEACPQGHPYTPENTYIGTRPDGRTYWKCRACLRAATKVWKAKNPERERERCRQYRARKREARQ